MDMNKAFFLRKEDVNPQWRLIDAKGKVPGRLATQIADILRGKDQAEFTSHTDSGDYVVVINASQMVFTGNKLDGKVYLTYSGYMGGQKSKTARQLMEKTPEKVLELAVKRMLPRTNKSSLSRSILKKLKVYAGSEHSHQAQISKLA
ncbi:MAG TPA: 50S ribosomal protein L13 [Candidatus Saccharimonadales bacterium]|nr:50S ribosomal protein L13 [Candidatus Saccharimonadales bacterium]